MALLSLLGRESLGVAPPRFAPRLQPLAGIGSLVARAHQFRMAHQIGQDSYSLARSEA